MHMLFVVLRKTDAKQTLRKIQQKALLVLIIILPWFLGFFKLYFSSLYIYAFLHPGRLNPKFLLTLGLGLLTYYPPIQNLQFL